MVVCVTLACSSHCDLTVWCAQAISASMTDGDLTATSCTVGFVGADSSFTILSDADLEPHVAAMKEAEDAPAGKQHGLPPVSMHAKNYFESGVDGW